MTRLWKEMRFTVVVHNKIMRLRYGMNSWHDELELEEEVELMHDIADAFDVGGVVDTLFINGRTVELYAPPPHIAWPIH